MTQTALVAHARRAISILAFLACGAPQLLCGACPPITPSPEWKNDIAFPSDPFRRDDNPQEPGWVKFAILTCDPTKVYFQDCRLYAFHYEFAKERLDPFLGMSRVDFDRVTLSAEGQQAVLGAVLMPAQQTQWSGHEILEYGIQLVRKDPYTPQQVVDYVNLVRGHVLGEGNVRCFYFPTYEQLASARESAAFLESKGIIVSSPERWARGNRVYSPGWALGSLKFFTADRVGAAFRAGELTSADVLLTDGVPADTPLVAGIVSLAPVTPNSHVVILSNSFQTPLAYLSLAHDVARANSLIGQRIVLRAYQDSFYGVGDVRLLELEGRVTEQQIAEILELKKPPPLELSPVTSFGAYGASTSALTPADVRYFGGKASHYGFLRRAIPASSPVAAALSFDLWTEFLDQEIAGGGTLRDHIDQVLAPFSYPPADMNAFTAAMADLRALIGDAAKTPFTAGHYAAILALLQDPAHGFKPEQKIRFRSSTNVEDTEQFTGAGLYDSYSGCLADDLDGNTAGPSHCDSSEAKERSIFTAIRRVFASFYNDNAVLERMRFGVDERDAGMAVLIHHSFPDQFELANGVATLEKQGGQIMISLVTQLGAVSVTNPEGGAVPEEVVVSVFDTDVYLFLERPSNLVQLGATVMNWEKDYRDLVALLVAVAGRFEAETKKTQFALDFEYKKEAPASTLSVKQVRQLRQVDTTPRITPFLLGAPTAYETFQGEAADVFSNHRLKSRWSLEARSQWITAQTLGSTFFTAVRLEYTDACEVLQLTGAPADFPAFRHTFDGSTATDGWELRDLANPRTLKLITEGIPLKVSADQCPILTIEDLGYGRLHVQVDYKYPVTTFNHWSDPPYKPTPTSTEGAVIALPLPQPESVEELQSRTFQDTTRGVTIQTQFYWVLPSGGIGAGYTAPLTRWVSTVIAGLTETPITLRGHFSQTIRPDHHNFGESFIFEPRLESGLPQRTLDELGQKKVHLIFVYCAREPGAKPVFRYLDEAAARHVCACSTPRFVRGDVNADLEIDLSDAILVLLHLFLAGDPPRVWSSADTNDDGAISLADAVYLLNFLFRGGAPPGPPFPEPGCGD